jgi:uncharacterized protein (TIGR02246 family)
MSSNSIANPGAAAQAAASVPQRIVEAWADNDADAFAAACATDATMILPGDVYLAGREQIRDYMKDAYSKQYKGTKVFGRPLGLRLLSGDVAVLVTHGGVIQAGNAEVTPEDTIRATWVVARYGDEWLVAAYQNTYVNRAA